MSFRPLIEGECGGDNSLVRLSSILARDGTPRMQNHTPADRFVDEYLAQNYRDPETFKMTSLLRGIEDVTAASQGPSSSSSLQFRDPLLAAENPSGPPRQMRYPLVFPNMAPHGHGMAVAAPVAVERPFVPLQFMEEDQTEPMVDRGREIRDKAKELVEAVVDQNVAYNRFISFMQEVGAGGVDLEGQRTYSDRQEQIQMLTDKYREEWAKLSDVGQHPWFSQLDQKVSPYAEYEFSRENDMIENLNALDIGKQKLKLGDFPGAVLCFEAAVKQNPKSAESWLLLGTTQAENEQDPQAIAALNRCVEIDPTRLTAHLALGASYTNENYTYLAYESFNNWLKANPKYSDLVPLDVDIASMNNANLQNHLQSLFLRAAQMNPSRIDPDIQCALGVLFNLSREYDKAVDCFRTALMVKSDDSRLWNRLGATLANGERSEEAVEAYYRALQLEPGFIRARYNVGITCMNLGAHKEAAEHFLVALNQQFKAQGITPGVKSENTTSSTIWSTLRMVCAFMGKHELTALIDNKDLAQLNRHFGIE